MKHQRMGTLARQHRRFLCLLAAVSLVLGMVGPLQVVGAASSVTVDGDVDYNTADDVSTIDITHTTGTGTDRLMLVGVSWNCFTTDQSISSVTFTPSGESAVSLSEVITQQAGTQLRYAAIYSLLNPPSGVSGTVAVTFTGSVASGIVAGVANFAGVDQTTPLGTPDGAGSGTNDTAPSVTLTGLAGDELVFDTVFQGASNESQTLTVGSGQTQRWNAWIANTRAAASTEEASGSSVTMSWTAGTASYWAIAAVPINPTPLVGSMTIDKTVTDVGGEGASGHVDEAGDVISYQVVVTNTGDLSLTTVTMTDTLVSNVGSPTESFGGGTAGVLEVGEHWTWTYTYTALQADIDDNGGGDGDIDNTATVDCDELEAESDSAAVPIDWEPEINVEKSSTTTAITTAGQVVPYVFVMTNPGNVTLSSITALDANCDADPVYWYGDDNSDYKIQITETVFLTCTHTVIQAEIDAGGFLTNTVTVDSLESEEDTDTYDIPIIGTTGSVTIVKQADPEGALQEFDFTGNLGAFSLTDDGTLANTKVFTDVTEGTYAVIETVPAGWNLTDIVCDDPGTTVDEETASALIDLDAGEDITCIFYDQSYVTRFPLILGNW
jgi:uncharacterized repeat protein (TIGR01451 family)